MAVRPTRHGLPSLIRLIVWSVAIAAAWVASGSLGLEISTGVLRISLLWLPAGLAVAAGYRIGILPAVFGGLIGSSITNALSFGLQAPFALLISLAQVSGPAVVAAVLRRNAFHRTFANHRDVGLFFLASLLGMLIPATGGLLVYSLVEPLSSQTAFIFWLSWWLGDSLGVLIGAPLLLSLDRSSLAGLRPYLREFVGWLIVVVAISFSHIVLSSELHQIRLPLAFLNAPLVLWAAMRFGPFGGSLAPFVVALAVTSATGIGRGPFSEGPATANSIALLWSYLTMLTTISLVTRGLQAERSRTKADLVRSESLLAGICQVQNDFILGQDTTQVVHQLLQTAQQLTRSEWSFLAEVSPSDSEPQFHVVTMAGRPFDLADVSIPPASEELQRIFQRFPELHDLASRAAREGQPQISDAATLREPGSMESWQGALVMPIRLRDQVIGVLGVARLARPYTGADVRAVDSILPTCAAIMDGAANRRARENAELLAKELAYFDPLTGLPNRRLLLMRLKDTLRAAQGTSRYGACFFIDLDDFKVINDTLGHQTGDDLLVQVAWRMREAVPREATVARFAGDEFVILLPWLADTQPAAERLAREHARVVLNVIRQPFQLGGATRHASASIGGCLLTPETASIDELLQNADAAMYGAKEAGRNNVQFFDPAALDTVQRQAHLQLDLHDALQNGGIQFHGQPLFNRSRQIVSIELLARWDHPRLGYVSPQDFIRVAEQSGLIQQLGMAAVETALSLLQDTPTSTFSVAVNVSVLQLQNPEFADFVCHALQVRRIPPTRLTLEITESHWLESSSDVVLSIETLYARGLRLVLDDFGTGYSSFSYLRTRQSTTSSRLQLCEWRTAWASRLRPKVLKQKNNSHSCAPWDAIPFRAGYWPGLAR
jgi:diguanylate cyclase (GGDEF)-like protein